ncbi:peptidylprolyl isomerase [Streptomyces somaliensis]|uniref:peptidylprolyl isomerase n=1 Tax=Streptomyces somaliensis TaxID=78355 RepID=UPI0020CB842D|nr:peptidylprolyl isomerase [Streptomyces somaliensis]MCP9946483.1 peptidylprolyl isomerase [Streptomyces somaliensis]MCP9960373.1 peptidylprolyl isomerase [Streptomyces somaliensis]MCP9973148.1 peptidylprolyl isomerase [Streptomyces somaliensis]
MVSSDQRRRQLAREKSERQRRRRTEARRKAGRRNAVVASALAVVLAAGGAVYASVQLTGRDADGVGSADGSGASPSPGASSPSPEPSMAVDTEAAYTMTLRTNVGDMVISMNAARTPRTVNSFKHLADGKYFDGTKCHRLTTQGIFVLQCGDPQGDGTGGPGYSLPDEDLASLGKAGPDGKVTFGAGTVAMANTGSPDSGGSQFFLVYRDSRLPPQYTPFGTLDAAGLKAVREVAGAGVGDGGGDGAPKRPVTIEKATVSRR